MTRLPPVLLAIIVLLLTCARDTQYPWLRIVYPRDNDTLAKGIITLKVIATDNIRIARVEFRTQDSLLGWGVAGLGDTYSLNWDATSVPNLSRCTLKVTAWDRAQNYTTQSISIVIYGAGPTYHSGQLTTDETWHALASPHIIQGTLEIGGSARPVLTIQPGCRVLFEPGSGIVCGNIGAGAIVANGRPEQPIIFSSHTATPAPGNWRTIRLAQLTMENTVFNHCTLEFGGQGGVGLLTLERTSAAVTNCVFLNSSAYGIWAGSNSSFSRFDSNALRNCQIPIALSADGVPTLGSGNRFTGNAQDLIEIIGGTVTTTATWANHNLPYLLSATVAIADAQAPVLTIAPGTTVLCAAGVELYAGLGMPGGLIADRVHFTSARSSPGPGDWQGISFYNQAIDAACRLTNCRIEYGGSEEAGNILIQNALPEIRGDSIGYSQWYGIYLDGTVFPPRESLLANNWFYGNLAPIGP